MKSAKESIKNNADIVAGKVKTAAGKATDNPKLEVKGNLQTAKGKINEKINKLTKKK